MHISVRNSPHNSNVKFSESVCVALVASLTKEMTAQSIAYHAHGTADSDKSCCYPWLVCHDIKSAMHCSLRLAPTIINHLTSYILIVMLRGPFTTCTNSGVHVLFHSLERNKVGKSGASALADSLRVNQSLKTLK